MKRNKMRMLLCVTMKTRLHCFGEKNLLVYKGEHLLMGSRWGNDNHGPSYKLLQVLENPLY